MVFHVCLSIPWLPRIKPAWLDNRSWTLSQDQALDRAKATLLGLAGAQRCRQGRGPGPSGAFVAASPDDHQCGRVQAKAPRTDRYSGYVIDTLEAALWAVWNTDNFKDAILLAANLADDADSVAATAGQIAGALYGVSGTPSEWVAKVAWSQHIRRLASRLFELSPLSDELDDLLYGRHG